MVTSTEVRWGPAIHRFGKQFDHGLVSAKWRWKTRKEKKKKRPDFAAMTSQSWPSFDEDLRIRLQKSEEPRDNCEKHVEKGGGKVAVTKTETKLGNRYTRLTECVFATIKKIVPV